MSEKEVQVQTEGPAVIVSFLKEGHDLADLLKKLDKAGKDAVKYLVSVLNDDKADAKLRVQCAKELLAFNISVSQQINSDEMTRLVAQAKLGGRSKGVGLTDGDQGKPATPALDFDTIREV